MDLIRDRKINLVRLSLLYLATRVLITCHNKFLKFNGCDIPKKTSGTRVDVTLKLSLF